MKTLTAKQIETRIVNKARRSIMQDAKWKAKSIRKPSDIAGDRWGMRFEMRWYPRLSLFKSNAGKNVFDPSKMEAWSYSWWKYLGVIKGKVVFNDFRYSVQTSQHQNKLRSVLRDLGIKVDMYIEAPRGLDNLQDAANHEFYRMAQLELKLEHCRKDSVKFYQKEIQDVKKRLDFLKRLGAKPSKTFQKDTRAFVKGQREARLQAAMDAREHRRAMERVTQASNAKQRVNGISVDTETTGLTPNSARPTLSVVR